MQGQCVSCQLQEWRDGKAQKASHIYTRLSPFQADARKYIAENFVSSGNSQDMIQELSKLTDTELVGQEPSTPQKKGKTTSQPKKDGQATSAIIVTTSKQTKAPSAKQPQSCKHCGKFVSHTDGICDVYNVPSVNLANSGIRDTPNMSVVFQNMDFGMDNDNSEYLFVNDFGNLDDLTLERFMQGVADPIRTSPVYDVSDDDVAPVQAVN